jgi:L-2,4-diaminobutyrate decarboxylase
MHGPDEEQRDLANDIAHWAMDRLSDRAARPAAHRGKLPDIAADGIGTAAAWQLLRDKVLPTAFRTDHPRYLAFIPGAPTVASVLADMAVSAAGVYGGSQLEAGTVVAAERAALEWLADLAGLPPTAHGAFVSGGSMANLSALVVARRSARTRHRSNPRYILAGPGAHSSIDTAGEVMGCDVLRDGDHDGRLDEHGLRRMLERVRPADVVGIVATGGTTNTGAVDALDGIAKLCAQLGMWLHVDAAYGGAALLSDRCRPQFAGIERADSVTIDPHKWLFTPFDCAAVLYRDPALARSVHAQRAAYLDVVSGSDQDNPADYALHLSRRPRGIPFWMSLLAHGTQAYEDAVATCLDLADYAADQIRHESNLELACDPSLSVVAFQHHGWDDTDYLAWSEQARARGLGLVTPTHVRGARALRFCFVNPMTTREDIDLILDDVLTHALPSEYAETAAKASRAAWSTTMSWAAPTRRTRLTERCTDSQGMAG